MDIPTASILGRWGHEEEQPDRTGSRAREATFGSTGRAHARSTGSAHRDPAQNSMRWSRAFEGRRRGNQKVDRPVEMFQKLDGACDIGFAGQVGTQSQRPGPWSQRRDDIVEFVRVVTHEGNVCSPLTQLAGQGSTEQPAPSGDDNELAGTRSAERWALASPRSGRPKSEWPKSAESVEGGAINELSASRGPKLGLRIGAKLDHRGTRRIPALAGPSVSVFQDRSR